MEHRLITGGEQFLPFARSCITKLKRLGLPYANQSFEIDGASVKVRIEPGHEYIRIEGVGGDLFGWGVLPSSKLAPDGYVADPNSALGVTPPQIPLTNEIRDGDHQGKSPNSYTNPNVFLPFDQKAEKVKGAKEESRAVTGEYFWSDGKKQRLLFAGGQVSHHQIKVRLCIGEDGPPVAVSSGAVVGKYLLLASAHSDNTTKFYAIPSKNLQGNREGDYVYGLVEIGVAPSILVYPPNFSVGPGGYDTRVTGEHATKTTALSWRFSPDGLKAIALESGLPSIKKTIPETVGLEQDDYTYTLEENEFCEYSDSKQNSFAGVQYIHRATFTKAPNPEPGESPPPLPFTVKLDKEKREDALLKCVPAVEFAVVTATKTSRADDPPNFVYSLNYKVDFLSGWQDGRVDFSKSGMSSWGPPAGLLAFLPDQLSEYHVTQDDYPSLYETTAAEKQWWDASYTFTYSDEEATVEVMNVGIFLEQTYNPTIAVSCVYRELKRVYTYSDATTTTVTNKYRGVLEISVGMSSDFGEAYPLDNPNILMLPPEVQEIFAAAKTRAEQKSPNIDDYSQITWRAGDPIAGPSTTKTLYYASTHVDYPAIATYYSVGQIHHFEVDHRPVIVNKIETEWRTTGVTNYKGKRAVAVGYSSDGEELVLEMVGRDADSVTRTIAYKSWPHRTSIVEGDFYTGVEVSIAETGSCGYDLVLNDKVLVSHTVTAASSRTELFDPEDESVSATISSVVSEKSFVVQDYDLSCGLVAAQKFERDYAHEWTSTNLLTDYYGTGTTTLKSKDESQVISGGVGHVLRETDQADVTVENAQFLEGDNSRFKSVITKRGAKTPSVITREGAAFQAKNAVAVQGVLFTETDFLRPDTSYLLDAGIAKVNSLFGFDTDDWNIRNNLDVRHSLLHEVVIPDNGPSSGVIDIHQEWVLKLFALSGKTWLVVGKDGKPAQDLSKQPDWGIFNDDAQLSEKLGYVDPGSALFQVSFVA